LRDSGQRSISAWSEACLGETRVLPALGSVLFRYAIRLGVEMRGVSLAPIPAIRGRLIEPWESTHTGPRLT